MPETSHAYSLADPAVQKVLTRLYNEVKKERTQKGLLGLRLIANRILGRTWSLEEYVHHVKDLYVPLSRERGTFAYLVARAINAKRIVEFGTAFGISTIYLAAAVKDNGGGIVIGSEMEPHKVKTAWANVEEAGLADYIEIRQGDARQTLADPGGTVDLLLNDGHKALYIPIVQLLTPYFRPGAVILGDNVTLGAPLLSPMVEYIEFMNNPQHGFTSLTIPLKDGMEYSVKL